MKIIYDTAQQNISYRNFMDDIRKAGRHLCYVHGADNDGVRWTHEALGKGTVDWEGIVRALVEINFDGYICTQSWSELPNDVDSVMRESREYPGAGLQESWSLLARPLSGKSLTSQRSLRPDPSLCPV